MKEVILSLMLSACADLGLDVCPEVEFDGLTGATVAEYRVEKSTGKETVVFDRSAMKRANVPPRVAVQEILKTQEM